MVGSSDPHHLVLRNHSRTTKHNQNNTTHSPVCFKKKRSPLKNKTKPKKSENEHATRGLRRIMGSKFVCQHGCSEWCMTKYLYHHCRCRTLLLFVRRRRTDPRRAKKKRGRNQILKPRPKARHNPRTQQKPKR